MNVAVEASVLSSMSELDLEFHLWGGKPHNNKTIN